MARGLDSDRLGKAGESKFELLCVSSGLFPQRVSWDRTGWDYLVEFPFPDSSSPLDSRPNPHEVKVQVKTVGHTAGTFKIRLSAAERIAKYPQAAFICVMVTDRENKFQQLYVLHVISDLLSIILKELRKCTAANSLQVNKRFLTLSFAKLGSPIAVSADTLRKQLETAIGPDPEQYMRMKRKQLANLGFEATRFKGSLTVPADSLSDLADIMLGLKPTQASDITTHEIRWDIPLPVHPSGTGELRFKPRGLPGQLVIRARNETLKLKVDVALPAIPNAPPEARKALISSPVIEMLLDFSTNSINFTGDRPEQALTIGEHRSVVAWTRLVTSDVAVGIEVKIKNKLFFNGHFSSEPADQDVTNMRQMQYLFRGLNRLLSHAGALDLQFSREEMGSQLQAISLMGHLCLLTPPWQRLSFKANTVKPLVLSSELNEMLILAHITLGGAWIGLAAVGSATITGDPYNQLIEVTGIGVREIERLSDGALEFSERMRAETGLALVLEVGKPEV